MEADKCLGAWAAKKWWDQEGLNLSGVRKDVEAGGMGETDI